MLPLTCTNFTVILYGIDVSSGRLERDSMGEENMLVYEDGKFCACGFAFALPNGFILNTEPMMCFPCGFGAWAPEDDGIYIEWEIETGCKGTYNELRELFNEGSGMYRITDISPIFINQLSGHHVAYSDKHGQKYEIRLCSGGGQELSVRVSSENLDIATALEKPSVQSAISSIWPWEPKEVIPEV